MGIVDTVTNRRKLIAMNKSDGKYTQKPIDYSKGGKGKYDSHEKRYIVKSTVRKISACQEQRFSSFELITTIYIK